VQRHDSAADRPLGVSVVEPSTLNVGSRTIRVERTPLLAAKSSFRTQSLQWASGKVLVLRPSVGSRAFALAFLFFGVPLTFAAVANAAVGQEPFGLVLVGAFVGLIFVTIGTLQWVLPLRFEFDAAAGQLRLSRPGRRWQRPLRDVLAVQLIEEPRSRRIGITYQLNLVLDDERQPRVNLSNHTDREATREVARELTQYLSVPLLE